MAVNDADFPSGQPSNDARLGAMGYDAKTGHRGGGIDNPRVVDLRKGAILIRFHKPPAAGEHPGDFGAWWFTPYEYRRICEYFGVDGRALVQGRSSGKSGLHGVLALLNEWYGNSPTQLSYVNIVQLTEPFRAFYGPGAPANLDNYARTLKPVRLQDGRAARQVYIHQCWAYQAAMDRLVPANSSTDRVFGSVGGLAPRIAQAPRLQFE